MGILLFFSYIMFGHKCLAPKSGLSSYAHEGRIQDFKLEGLEVRGFRPQSSPGAQPSKGVWGRCNVITDDDDVLLI